jgi:hypothetical protein
MGNVFARERMRRPVSAQGTVARGRFVLAEGAKPTQQPHKLSP